MDRTGMATPVSQLTAREYQSSIRSTQALMDRVDEVRMHLNDHDPAKRALGDVMKRLLGVQQRLVQEYDALRRVSV